jgi:hypothetical protein
MDSIRDFVDVEGAAVQAVLRAMTCCAVRILRYRSPAVLAAVEQGVVPETRVDESRAPRSDALKAEDGAVLVRRMDAGNDCPKRKSAACPPLKGEGRAALFVQRCVYFGMDLGYLPTFLNKKPFGCRWGRI